MFTYKITTGEIFRGDGYLMGIGYSGHDKGKNNPDMCNVHDVGPIPLGVFEQGVPRDDEKLGKFVIPLIPKPEDEMHGRSGFYCHGDSIKKPGTASHGCIILPFNIRVKLYASGENIQVIV